MNWLGLLAILGLKAAIFLVGHFISNYRVFKNSKKDVIYAVVRPGKKKDASAKKVVVTNGSSYLGRHVVEELLNRLGDKACVVCVDRQPEPNHPSVMYIRADLQHHTHMKLALAGADCVIHLLDKQIQYYSDDQQKGFAYDSMKSVVEACLEQDVKSIILSSSLESLIPKDAGGSTLKLSEGSAHPGGACLTTLGDIAKAAEQLVQACSSHVLQAAVLRLGVVYGQGDKGPFEYATSGSIYHTGRNQVPWVWVKDAAMAHALAADELLWPDSGTKRSKLRGAALHIAHDPSDTPTLDQFLGVRPLPPPPSASSVAPGSSSAADIGSSTRSAWGLPLAQPKPAWQARLLCTLNDWARRHMLFAPLHPMLTCSNLRLWALRWDVGVGKADELMGWKPTPFRVAAGEAMAAATAKAKAVAGASAEGVVESKKEK